MWTHLRGNLGARWPCAGGRGVCATRTRLSQARGRVAENLMECVFSPLSPGFHSIMN